MASQERVEKPVQKRTTEADAAQLAEEDAAVQAAQSAEQPDLSDLDDLLDEIDTILEEQAVLTNYRQKGGQ